jgi:hypothetical protein
MAYMDRLFGANEGELRIGGAVELPVAEVRITAMTEDGRVAEATFHFRVPIEDPSLRWLLLRPGGYEDFELPAIGQTVRVPPPFD